MTVLRHNQPRFVVQPALTFRSLVYWSSSADGRVWYLAHDCPPLCIEPRPQITQLKSTRCVSPTYRERSRRSMLCEIKYKKPPSCKGNTRTA
eukprot:1059169-Rhodomonas_salina.5